MKEKRGRFGQLVRQRRKALGLSLREFCRRNGFDPANVSRIERGISSPPKSAEIIDSFAQALEFNRDSVEWRNLHLLAAAETGQLPDALAADPAKLRRVIHAFDRSGFQWTRAIHLESNADLRMFQARLPEFIRKLIHATTTDLSRIAFPAGEGIQRPGFDGIVETDVPNPFVPAGRSVWEMGTNKDFKKKANEDFEKRSSDKSTSAEQRRNMTYVQVTPRKWVDKEKWCREKNALSIWKEVRVYDSADLEEWLELAPAVDAWIAGIFGIRPNEVTSLADYWENLRNISAPALSRSVFLVSRLKEREAIENWLKGPATTLAFETTSPQDVIDFFAAYVKSLDETLKISILSKSVIVESLQAWNEMSLSAHPMVLIPKPGLAISSQQVRETEKNGHHVLLSATRLVSCDVTLKLSRPLNHELEEALVDCGFKTDFARKITRASGGSLSVLKRRIAAAPSSELPAWSVGEIASKLVPLILVGEWHDGTEADRSAIEKISGKPYTDVMEVARNAITMEEPPLMSNMSIWNVVSREDSWDLLAQFLTDSMLDRFEDVAIQILQDDDPRYELPADDRWLAAIHNKHPMYSGNIKKGVIETLALLGSRSDVLPNAIKMGIQLRIERVVNSVLSPAAAWQRWSTLSRHLPDIAEAAPETFMQAVKQSVLQEDSPVVRLFDETGNSWMGGSAHCGLLWALETLAWQPEYLSRVSLLLASLEERTISSRRGNSPLGSLRTIYLPWLPHTTATVEQRIKSLRKVLTESSDAGWKLIIELMPRIQDSSFSTHFPNWRDWASTWSRDVLQEDFDKITSSCAELIVEQVGNDFERWDLILENIGRIPEEYQARLASQFLQLDIETWKEEPRRMLAEKLRKTICRHRDNSIAPWAMSARIINELDAIRRKCELDNPIQRHLWLFNDDWVELEGLYELGIKQHDAKLDALRMNALKEIFNQNAFESVKELLSLAKAPFQVGWSLAGLEPTAYESKFLPFWIDSKERMLHAFALGYCRRRFSDSGWKWVDNPNIADWTSNQKGKFIAWVGRLASEAWNRAKAHGPETEATYWKNVDAWMNNYSHVEFVSEKFFKSERPITAIGFLHSCIREELKPDLDIVARALELASHHNTKGNSPEKIADVPTYVIQKLISYLQDHEEFDSKRLALIEWKYLQLLRYSEVSPVTLFAALRADPDFFVRLIRIMFRSENDAELSSYELSASESAAMENAFHLLHDWQTVPGISDDGTVDGEKLAAWVNAARNACKESGHLGVCECQIGEQLAYAPFETEDEDDKSWPCIAVRDVLENSDSEAMFNGFHIGILNKRGARFTSPFAGGESEQKLQEKYAAFAKHLAIEWPSTAACLQRLADDYGRRAREEDANAELRKRF